MATEARSQTSRATPCTSSNTKALPSRTWATCDGCPPRQEIEALGTVHVALVPVGGGGGLNAAKAAEVISLLEPGYVIPMHYSTPRPAPSSWLR